MWKYALILPAITVSACATVPATAEPDEPQPKPVAQCDAAPVQAYAGKEATAEVGAAILAGSGAATLRWGPPRTAWTMDYRQDRVNVRYDDDMVIEAVTCG